LEFYFSSQGTSLSGDVRLLQSNSRADRYESDGF